MSDRYQVVMGSESAHCCFEATVIDTAKEVLGHPDWVCECFDPPRAHDIAAALNAADEAPLEPTIGIPTKCFLVTSRNDCFCPEKTCGFFMSEREAGQLKREADAETPCEHHVEACIIMPVETFYELCPDWRRR